jgi:hypothetical protein
MWAGSARRGRGGQGHDGGAVTVETAIVLPILLFIMFAVMEIGWSLKTYSALAGAVRSGGRTASVIGGDPQADAEILTRIEEEMGSGNGEIEYVVIWHATGSGDTVPPDCLPSAPFTANTTSVGVDDGGTDDLGACNVYIKPEEPDAAFDMANGSAPEATSYYFGCQGTSDPDADTKVDCSWPGKNRRTLTSSRFATPAEPTDFVGIHIRVRHSYFTRFFGTALTLTDSGISMIEPQGYDYG